MALSQAARADQGAGQGVPNPLHTPNDDALRFS